jgi:glucokinase
MIRFKAERGCMLAVQIEGDCLSFLLTDLSGTELEMAQVPLAGKKTTPEAVCQAIGDEVRRLLRKNRKTREQLLVLVVGVPAITDVDEGVVLSISTLENWRSVPLRTLLSKVVECPVLLENDTNLAALGERYRGAAQKVNTFVSISIGANVSAGIVLNGKIHHGAQWAAGEIAYLRLPNVARKHPELHKFGELEAVLTKSGIVQSWQNLLAETGGRTRSRSKTLDAKAVLDLARTGDVQARKIVQGRAVIVSDIVVNLSLILNPGLVLLGGEVGSHPVMLSSVERQLERCEFAVPRIAAATLGHEAVLWGAVALALEVIPSILLPPPPASLLRL